MSLAVPYLLGHIWTVAAAAASDGPNVGSGHEDR